VTHHIPIPDDLWVELEAKSTSQGKPIEELAEAALRQGLDDTSLLELLEYGAERGRILGFREEDAGDVVHAWRQQRTQ
jgi:hypothetical protein